VLPAGSDIMTNAVWVTQECLPSVVTDFADRPLLGVGAVGEFLTLWLIVAFGLGFYVGMKEIHQPIGELTSPQRTPANLLDEIGILS
jgi:hypothetical protein